MSRETIIKKMREIDLIDFRDEDEDEHVAELVNKVASIVAVAVAKEREECAKVCNSTAWTASIDEWKAMTKKDVAEQSMHACAAAIRARGEAA